MAARNRRRPAARRRREQRRKAGLIGGVGGLVLLAVYWQVIWPYLVGGLALAGAALGGWWLWRTDRLVRRRDHQWRQQEALEAGRRSLTEVDAMSGGEFEDFVVELCRRDGCAEVRRVGGSHDDGADVRGRLPDGRSMVVQCKRYAPKRRIPSHEVRDLLGARVHFKADVAVFVTTTYFTGPAERTAVQNGVIAVHRDHLGSWNNGASLLSLSRVNGAGQGDRRHRARRKQTYE
ncbi:restriction endonuclease [Streptomyces sp. NPDC059467]|uniref:restriction endonuclease n=1 Tax=Streptomyces sp. NPDC059467 TaxID=3346844 RepID=UPI0036CB5C20